MIHRAISPYLTQLLQQFPAVTLIGPRQCGKTTLAKTYSPLYFDLEQDSEWMRLDLEWESVLTSTTPVILDEAQERPALFKKLRATIDQDRGRFGKFIILGSVSPHLLKNVSESLAGRVARVSLGPLTLNEYPNMKELWLRGGYPDGLLFPANYAVWHHNYLRSLAERDLPNWGLHAQAKLTEKLFLMLAHCHGQIFNASQLSKSLGITHPTVKSYLEFLEGAFLLRLLPPFAKNIKKRLIKSPKVYWRDSGLLHALLKVSDDKDLLARPFVGHSWEGFVIEQILGVLEQKGVSYEASFLRTVDGKEIDLVLEFGQTTWAIEIKLSSMENQKFFESLKATAPLIQTQKSILISNVQSSIFKDDRIVANLADFLAYLGQLQNGLSLCAP